jgi:RimJ/RimL family protein N-acetyltransferase
MMFARTERLLLRPGFIEDAPELARAVGDERIARNLARLPWPYAESHARDWLSLDVADPRLPVMLITQRTNGSPRIVGGIGIHDSDDGAELGYWIARPYWGLGFATEAGRAVMAIARAIGLPRLVSGHFVDNPASGAVLRKLGFRATGRVVPRHSLARGEDVPCALFEEGDAENAVDPMTRFTTNGTRERIGADEDMRQSIRLLAA